MKGECRMKCNAQFANKYLRDIGYDAGMYYQAD